ncbi:hypothetical protein QEZ54_21135 [Catellatospora sp. KI3]|uniref:hypothetical protein n=1 Tax=Catellatospora sp. KI3 TaxID=3041620 RepID=UPI002482213E|nr:hypothetical protein [Catellatospora sp. KI3]MDI1463489.1 hypothetical protein [Catellatospora sp. KI3]
MRTGITRRVAVAATLLAAAFGTLITASPARASLPAVDPYQPYVAAADCTSSKYAKPGVVAFRDMTLSRLGGGDSGIVACTGYEHMEGRAWDWTNYTSNPADVARVQTMLDWMFATDDAGNQHAMARRLGIAYVIWNKRIINMYAADKTWHAYTGDNPHTDHVHFAFSWAGALQQTTWFTTSPRPDEWYPGYVPSGSSQGSVVFAGNLYKFVRAADGGIKYWYGSGGAWSGLNTVPGSGDSGTDPVAAVFGGNLYVFTTTADGQVRYWYGNGGPWNGPNTVPGSAGTYAAGSLASAVSGGNLYIFSVATTGTAVRYWYGSGGPWSAANTVPDSSGTAKIASAVFGGNLYLFSTTSTGSVRYWYGSGGPWSAANTVPGSGGDSAVATAVFAGNLYLFATASDGTVKYWYGNGGPWSGLNTVPGSSGSSNRGLSGAVFGGNLYVFANSTGGSTRYWYGNGGPWSTANTIGAA